MPELPEVETTIRFIRPKLVDRVIQSVTATNKGESTFNIPFQEVQERLQGQSLVRLDRRGKWMLFTFEPQRHNSGTIVEPSVVKVVGHLRMSGRYKIADEVLDLPHNRFQLHLDNGKVINYLDQRRFGTFHFVDDFEAHKGLAALGADVLSEEFTEVYLANKLKKLKKPIYSALLDQTVIAGLGNIYVNEILHASRIHPLKPANSLTHREIEAIVHNTATILAKALELKGTTLIDNLYQDPEGKTGEFAKLLQVYGKKKDPNIEVLKIGGRSVFVHLNTPK
jgi:formamidopyrimidine-DNA glycosylase